MYSYILLFYVSQMTGVFYAPLYSWAGQYNRLAPCYNFRLHSNIERQYQANSIMFSKIVCDCDCDYSGSEKSIDFLCFFPKLYLFCTSCIQESIFLYLFFAITASIPMVTFLQQSVNIKFTYQIKKIPIQRL